MKEIPWRGANAASQLNLKIYYSLEFVVSLSFLNWARIRSATIGDVKKNVKWFPYKMWRHGVDKISCYAIASYNVKEISMSRNMKILCAYWIVAQFRVVRSQQKNFHLSFT